MTSINQHLRLRFMLPPLFLLFIIVIASCVGKFPISLSDYFAAIARLITHHFSTENNDIDIVLWDIRLPRIVAGILAGAALSSAGAAYQGMFKNPLVSPDILGVSSGAALGSVTAIYLNMPILTIQLMAFIGGILTVLLVYFIAQLARRHDPVLALVLSGIAIGSTLGATISFIKMMADPYKDLQTMIFWMLGALNLVSWNEILSSLLLISIGMLPLLLLRWRMNLLSLDDDEASTLGINIKKTRLIFILSATLITATTISITGIIGWIGLVIPHISRLWIGPDFRYLLPTSLFIGAAFLVLTDTLARTLFPVEMPLGIMTAFIGAPFFLGLLIKGGIRR